MYKESERYPFVTTSLGEYKKSHSGVRNNCINMRRDPIGKGASSSFVYTLKLFLEKTLG
jgi:hypothetical protein